MYKITRFILHKWYVLLVVIGAIIGQCYLQLMLPEYMGKIQMIIATNVDAADITVPILENGGWMLLISVGIVACTVLQIFSASYISSYVGKELRKRVFEKVNSLSLSDYNKYGTATLITRTTNDIEQIKSFFMMSIRIMVLAPSFLIIALVKTLMIASNNYQQTGSMDKYYFTLVIAISIPLVLVIMGIIFMVASPLFRTIQVKVDNLTIVLRENLTGIRVIRAYNQEQTQAQKFAVANEDMTKTNTRIGHIMSIAMPAVTIIFNFCFIGIYGLSFYLAEGSNVMDQQFASLLGETQEIAQYAMQIMTSFMMFAMVFISFPQAAACARRVSEILTLKSSENEQNIDYDVSLLDNSPERGTIEFDNVTFAYPDSGKPCIENISFKTKKGQTTAIIGSTGSGKSTIINLIPRFYDASEGVIKIDGQDITTIPHTVVRDRIGFVPQQAVLFYGTIRDNLKFGKPDATVEEVNKALNVAQAEHFISKLPEGLDTFVAQGGKNFSGGQKQRLAIARALVKKPEIYVFDDSFSALDFKTDVKLRTALKSYTEDASVIVVAQRVSSIIDADNIIVVNDGRVVDQGTHSELLSRCEVYQDIVKSQLDPDEVEKTIRLSKEMLLEGGDN